MQNKRLYLLESFDRGEFVSAYWQKKPCLIKSFVPNFIDPIDEHDLAGLAQESDIDSRIVSVHNGKWNAEFGPFDDFSKRCVGKWTLLVQGVDRYIQSVGELAKYVDFIPSWRFDDVMVSYSVRGAGVGAHIDQYDVFILQGKGQRRWQVGLPQQELQEINKHPLLKLVDDFEPVIDYVLEPGDAIYIPPKHPHKGETIEASLNYSLGFRAPTDIELLHGLIDYGDETLSNKTRYSDPDISTLRQYEHKQSALSKAAVTEQEMARLKQHIVEIIESKTAEQALLKFISRQEIQCFEPEKAYTVSDVESILNEGQIIQKVLGLNPIYNLEEASKIANSQYTEEGTCMFRFFVDGDKYEVDGRLTNFLIPLISSSSFSGYPPELPENLFSSFTEIAAELLNSGYWYVDSRIGD